MGSKAENRRKFGVSGKAIPATRALAVSMEHFTELGIDGKSVIAINDVEGTFTACNVYDGNLGKNYDAEGMTHNLPEATSDKWKAWHKKGYRPIDVADLDVLELVEVETQTEVETAETQPA